MKKLAIAFALAASLGVAACDEPEAVSPAPDGEVVIDDECPRADGEPCK